MTTRIEAIWGAAEFAGAYIKYYHADWADKHKGKPSKLASNDIFSSKESKRLFVKLLRAELQNLSGG